MVFIFSKETNIPATCSLEAVPLPVIDCLIFFGEYSVTGISLDKATAIEIPCALPNFNIDCGFLPINGASIATSSGLYSSIR